MHNIPIHPTIPHIIYTPYIPILNPSWTVLAVLSMRLSWGPWWNSSFSTVLPLLLERIYLMMSTVDTLNEIISWSLHLLFLPLALSLMLNILFMELNGISARAIISVRVIFRGLHLHLVLVLGFGKKSLQNWSWLLKNPYILQFCMQFCKWLAVN